jgi:Transglutaminase-like superfamily
MLKFLRLPGSEQKILVKAVALLWAVRIGLWFLPFQRLRDLLSRKNKRSSSTVAANTECVETIAGSVRAMSRYAPAATCLVQALVTATLLEESGLPACLRIGVARSTGVRIEAHAWVESNGKVVIGGSHADLARFTVLHTVEGI